MHGKRESTNIFAINSYLWLGGFYGTLFKLIMGTIQEGDLCVWELLLTCTVHIKLKF